MSLRAFVSLVLPVVGSYVPFGLNRMEMSSLAAKSGLVSKGLLNECSSMAKDSRLNQILSLFGFQLIVLFQICFPCWSRTLSFALNDESIGSFDVMSQLSFALSGRSISVVALSAVIVPWSLQGVLELLTKVPGNLISL